MNNAHLRYFALRSLVFQSLVGYLPFADVDHAAAMIRNLRLQPVPGEIFETDRLQPLLRYSVNLKVTPDINTTGSDGATAAELIEFLRIDFTAERLLTIPGFYKDAAGAVQVNLPKRCAVFAYGTGPTITGVCFQPLDVFGRYFLLSSVRFGGPKAAPLPADIQQLLPRH